MRPLLLACLAVPLVSGCYFVDGDDDGCDFGGAGLDQKQIALPVPTLRNPDSGQCEEQPTTGGGGQCDPCGICPPTDEPTEPPPDWGACESACTGLDELTCLATDGCQGAYLTACVGGGCPADGYNYYGCWQVAPQGATRGGTCEGLGAYDCSRHDDCVTRHVQIVDCVDCTTDPTVGAFESCAAEPEIDAACATLGEEACVGRADCTPLYEGVDCTCTGDACSCADWVFTSCE